MTPGWREKAASVQMQDTERQLSPSTPKSQRPKSGRFADWRRAGDGVKDKAKSDNEIAKKRETQDDLAEAQLDKVRKRVVNRGSPGVRSKRMR